MNAIELFRFTDLIRKPLDPLTDFKPTRFLYGVQYSWLLCVFAIVLVFSVFIPLILPVGTIFFAVKVQDL
jgi:hypothetical protein